MTKPGGKGHSRGPSGSGGEQVWKGFLEEAAVPRSSRETGGFGDGWVQGRVAQTPEPRSAQSWLALPDSPLPCRPPPAPRPSPLAIPRGASG